MLGIFYAIQPSYSQFKYTNDLIKLMREYEKMVRGEKDVSYDGAGYFVGYVIGVTDVTYSLNLYSLPQNVTQGQICAIVIKYINEHPEEWNHFATNLIINALHKSYPPIEKE
jgi:hypothetical protein